MWPEVRAILGPLAEESDVVLVCDYFPTSVEYQVRPHIWRGAVGFTLTRQQSAVNVNWQVSAFDRVAGWCKSAEDWSMRPLTDILAALHQAAMERLANLIDAAVADLARAETEEEAGDAHAELVRLAPERAAEWDALLAERLAIHEAEAERWAERLEDFAAYLRDLRVWRTSYEHVLASNRHQVATIQSYYDTLFTRYELAFAAADVDRDSPLSTEPTIYKVWASAAEPDATGYWLVYDTDRIVRRRFTNVLWVSEAIRQNVTAAGEGPWRASVYVERAGRWIHCLVGHRRGLVDDLSSATYLDPLPEEPAVTDYGNVFADGLTADEYRRINEVIGDMERAGIPF